jgi:16S rRNA C1402 (ribose-2'-O) methylase RsmI
LGELALLGESEANLARGEITVVVEGAPAEQEGDRALLRRTLGLLLPEMAPARAAAVAAQLAGVPKNEAYSLAMEMAGKEAR